MLAGLIIVARAPRQRRPLRIVQPLLALPHHLGLATRRLTDLLSFYEEACFR